MKIRQTARHFASRKALEVPGVRALAKKGLVDLHTRISLGQADEAHREARRDHLDAFYAGTIDMYLAALQRGYSEAEAREITHIVANFDFYNHGWTEMMEFPADELDAHFDRYADFFEAHDVGIDSPLGEFAPDGGVPAAPATPEKLDTGEYERAEGGYADDVYVEDESGAVHVGGDAIEPSDVDPTDAPGVE